jgi:hypothetical protein
MESINKNLTLFLVFLVGLAGCHEDKDGIMCGDEREDAAFCEFVNTSDFHLTGPLIDNFLKKIKKNDEFTLKLLKEWLECKSCINQVEIICNGCIYTWPAQSELKVDFVVDNQVVILVLDIWMEEKLRFAGYHGYAN